MKLMTEGGVSMHPHAHTLRMRVEQLQGTPTEQLVAFCVREFRLSSVEFRS